MNRLRCDVCNAELSQCGLLGLDGEPSLDCKECQLREQCELLVQRAERAEAALRERNVNAERYEWLTAGTPKDALQRPAHIAVLTRNGGFVATGEQANAAIDAARGKS